MQACTVTHAPIAQTNVTRQEMHRPTKYLLFTQAKREERAAELRVKGDPLINTKNVPLIKDYPISQIANVDLAASFPRPFSEQKPLLSHE